MSTSSWFPVAVSLIALPAVAAGPVGYAQATGYFKKDSRPTLYQPLNVLDARDATAWCSPTSDPLNELLTFGFNGPVKLEELRISSGNNFDANTWNDFARARKIAIRSGKQTQTLTLEDLRGAQSVPLNPPMLGSRFTIEILDTYPADDPDAPVCLTDVVFVAEGKALNGAWLTTRLKFDKYTSAVMGTWYAGFEGTPDRFLSLNFDGTFRYSYEPFDTTRNKEKVLQGSYDPSASRIVFEVGGKKYGVKFSKDPAKKGSGQVLSLEGELPEDLKGEWRSHP
ncbi:MAG: NADase-type glycan-binding domain-containing protein [Myxococcota bacterium]